MSGRRPALEPLTAKQRQKLMAKYDGFGISGNETYGRSPIDRLRYFDSLFVITSASRPATPPSVPPVVVEQEAASLPSLPRHK